MIGIQIIFVALAFSVREAEGASFSFPDNLIKDDDVQVFNFVVGSPSKVMLRAWSYAGGAEDPAILWGGFNGTEFQVYQNGDRGPGPVGADPATHVAFETHFSARLSASDYPTGVMPNNNSDYGVYSGDAFLGDGTAGDSISQDFSQLLFGYFYDSIGKRRESPWGFDILDIGHAEVVSNGILEPSTLLILGIVLAGIAGLRRKFIN